MTKTTEKQLINSLKQLKEIKPRKEWAVLLKSQILTEQKAIAIPANQVGIMNVIQSLFFQRKFAYSFAAALLLIAGVFGFVKYAMPGDLLFPVKKIAEQSQASLAGQTKLNQDVAILSSRINDLAKVAKEGRTDNIPSAISEINANMSQLAKSLKKNPVKDPQTLKEIANSLKTLADVPGTDLSENSDVKDLYQIVAQSQIADLQKTTLTDSQKKTLIDIEDLYNQGKYTDALEKILLISK
ncbi:MAG: hypothetical protein NTY81_00680 [Candidatus Staskawiczbacteria bacterium]|nr:hypothetical protein [Candidatus Staskawiczbacteria bacterium]